MLLRQAEPDIEQAHANPTASDQVLAEATEKTDGMTPGRFEAGGIGYVGAIFQPSNLPSWAKRGT